ncbi:hypothetical protein, partial [Hyalangium rubrum]
MKDTMKISNLLRNTAIATSAILLAACSTPGASVSQNNAATASEQTVKLQQIRSKTSPCPVVTGSPSCETTCGHTPGGGPWSWRRNWSSSVRRRSG